MKTGEIIIQYFKIAFFRGMYSIPIQGTVEQLSSFFRSRNAMSVLTENLVFYSDHVVTWSLAQVCVLWFQFQVFSKDWTKIEHNSACYY